MKVLLKFSASQLPLLTSADALGGKVNLQFWVDTLGLLLYLGDGLIILHCLGNSTLPSNRGFVYFHSFTSCFQLQDESKLLRLSLPEAEPLPSCTISLMTM